MSHHHQPPQPGVPAAGQPASGLSYVPVARGGSPERGFTNEPEGIFLDVNEPWDNGGIYAWSLPWNGYQPFLDSEDSGYITGPLAYPDQEQFDEPHGQSSIKVDQAAPNVLCPSTADTGTSSGTDHLSRSTLTTYTDVLTLSGESSDWQPTSSQQLADPRMAQLVFEPSKVFEIPPSTTGKRALCEVVDVVSTEDRDSKIARSFGASELLDVSSDQIEILNVHLQQWQKRSQLPTDREIKNVANSAKLSPFKVALWFGDRIKLTARPGKATGRTDTAQANASVDPELRRLLEKFITDAQTRDCAPGRSSGKYSCTWGCGYSTDSRDAWERHEEKKQPQNFWICYICRHSNSLQKGQIAFMTHRCDKFTPHVHSCHESEHAETLRARSKVEYHAPFLRQCTFKLRETGSACNHTFHSWRERNNHYVAHFNERLPMDSRNTSAPSYPVDDSDEDEQDSPSRFRGLINQSRNDIGFTTSSTSSNQKIDQKHGQSSLPNSESKQCCTDDRTAFADKPEQFPPSLLRPTSPGLSLSLIDVERGRLVDANSNTKFLALRYDLAELDRELLFPCDKSSRSPKLLMANELSKIVKKVMESTLQMGFKFLWINDICQIFSLDKTVDDVYNAATLFMVISQSQGPSKQIRHYTCHHSYLATVQSWAQQSIDFHTVQPLGRGAYGFVEKVEARPTSQVFARKIVFRDMGKVPTTSWYLQEIEVMQKLQNFEHPHIARFVAAYFDYSSNAFNILMSPVADCDLRQFLESPARFPNERRHLFEWFMSLAEALAYMHRLHCRHKDIKPANILISKNRVLLTDFGTAFDFSSTSESQTSGGGFMTPKYCAPEVAARKERGRSADVFSLGCVFSEMAAVGIEGSLSGLRGAVNLAEDKRGHSATYHQRITELSDWIRSLATVRSHPHLRRVLGFTERMIAQEPRMRPTADDIVKGLCPKAHCDGLKSKATCHCCPCPDPQRNLTLPRLTDIPHKAPDISVGAFTFESTSLRRANQSALVMKQYQFLSIIFSSDARAKAFWQILGAQDAVQWDEFEPEQKGGRSTRQKPKPRDCVSDTSIQALLPASRGDRVVGRQGSCKTYSTRIPYARYVGRRQVTQQQLLIGDELSGDYYHNQPGIANFEAFIDTELGRACHQYQNIARNHSSGIVAPSKSVMQTPFLACLSTKTYDLVDGSPSYTSMAQPSILSRH